MDRRKQLKGMYKSMKPDMGVFIVKSNLGNKCHIEGTQNLKGAMNSTRFKLNLGSHPNKELQKEWKEQGESAFSIEVLEYLKYDEDESKTDYGEELDILKMVWQENLSQKGIKFYKSTI
ncbi:MAG: GIY-YIG nuclease family protein [Clostridiaceae bacterium]|nr:GIY-YIG nuclease family protein [Clostridiaceae bacterium]